MNPSCLPSRSTASEIRVVVRPEDIEEMHDRLDSGMADQSTANAIVLALRRELGPSIKVRTVKVGRESWAVRIGSQVIPLPAPGNQWMEDFSRGKWPRPLAFRLPLPTPFPFPELRRESLPGASEVA